MLRLLSAFLLAAMLTAAVPAADILVERTETTYRFESNGTGTIAQSTRSRALTEAGRSTLSQIPFPFMPATQELKIDSCKVIRPDGKEFILDPTSAIEAAPSMQGRPVFVDEKVKTLSIPDLHIGDAVECHSTTRIHTSLKAGDFWQIHYRSVLHQVDSELVVLDLPSAKPATFSEDPRFPSKRGERTGRVIYEWSIASPAPTKSAVALEKPLFAVSTLRTWQDMGSWFESLADTRAAITPDVQALSDQLTRGKNTPREKVEAIYQYVSTSVRYLSLSIGLGRFQPHSAADVIHNGYGDCKDKHTLLAALLSAAGIASTPALAMVGYGIPYPDVPAPSQFTHEFSVVDAGGERIWLDTTLETAPMGMLIGLRGKQALLLEHGKTHLEIVPSNNPFPDFLRQRIVGKLASTGDLSFDNQYDSSGVFEIGLRQILRMGNQPLTNMMIAAIGGIEAKTAKLDPPSSPNAADLSKKFTIVRHGETSAFIDPSTKEKQLFVRGGTFLALVAIPGLDMLGNSTNPIAREESLELDLSSTYETELPLPVKVSRPFGSYESTYAREGDRLRISRKLTVTNPKVVTESPDEWAGMERVIVSDRNQGVVIRRTSVTPALSTSKVSEPDPTVAAMRALQAKQYEKARDLLLKAVEKDPKASESWHNLGFTQFELADYKGAEQSYRRELDLNPSAASGHSSLALALRRQRHYVEAISEFQKQLELNPLDSSNSALAYTYIPLERWNDAALAFARTAKVNPKSADAQVQWGRALAHLGKEDEAKLRFARALELDPGPGTRNDVAYNRAEAGIDLADAKTAAESALAEQTKDLCEGLVVNGTPDCVKRLDAVRATLDTVGYILFKQGELAKAEPYLVAAHQLKSTSPAAEHLGLLRLQQGKLDEAVRLCVEAERALLPLDVPPHALRGELDKAVGADKMKSTIEDMPAVGLRTFLIPGKFTSPQGKSLSTYTKVALRASVDETGALNKPTRTSGPEDLASVALADTKGMRLETISWPGHVLKTARAIEFGYSPNGNIKAWWTVAK